MTSVRDEVIEEKYGEAFTYDPNFKGPIKNRSCTDVLCLIVFLSFIVGWLVVAGFAYREGKPELLLYPTDSEGNVCGVGEFKERPYLFFFDLTQCLKTSVVIKGCQTPQVCVEKCPDKTYAIYQDKPPTTSPLICKYGTEVNNNAIELVKNKICAAYYINSMPVTGRCIPNVNISKTANSISGIDGEVLKDANGNNITAENLGKSGEKLAEILNAREIGERIFQDFSSAWWMIIVFLVASMIVSFIWILLMRWMAGIMVYLSIIFVIGVIGFVSGYSLYTYYNLETGNEAKPIFQSEFINNLSMRSSSKKTWLGFGIVFGVIWLILILMLLFLRKRISLAIGLIKESSKAIGCITSSLFFPILPYALQLVVFVFWGSVALYIASAGKASYIKFSDNSTSTKGSETIMFNHYLKDDNLARAQIYNLFGFFWAMFFVTGIGQVSLAGAFASYYWAWNKPKDVPSLAILSSMGRCFRYHLGSVAFGSLIIAIVRMIRVAIEYVDSKCKKYDNPVTKCILCCCKCCFWCLEKFMKFITKNAYIMIAVYGKNFCSSAKEAFQLLMRNVVRVVVLDKVTDYLLFLGKLVVVGLTAIAAFFFFSGKIKYLHNHSPELNYYFLPVITVTVGAYLIATGFFNVYSMAVDTLFLSFLEDCERNDGSEEKPYLMSKELMKILGKKNKFQDAKK